MQNVPDPAGGESRPAIPPPTGPSWCDRAKRAHDLCEEREQHESRWYMACRPDELDRYRVRLSEIRLTDGTPLAFVELEIMRDGEILEFLLQIGSARLMASALRRLVELHRVGRAR